MTNFSRLRKYLSQPYPSEENTWKIIIPISVFVLLFMVIFQPFGLNNITGNLRYPVLAGYGLVTFVILVINLQLLPWIFPKLFCDERWTFLKELIFFLWILFTIGLGNFLYSSWALGFRLSFGNIIGFQVYTLVIGVIPIATLTIVKQNYLNRRNREEAESITSSIRHRKPAGDLAKEIRITSDNGKESVTTGLSGLAAIRSDGNYITIFYLQKGKLISVLLRNTMKYAETLLSSYPGICKCHRPWLVNLDMVIKVNGNSQGLRLHIDGLAEEIPVARSNSAELRTLLS
jgi:hypothetical protein